MKLIYFDTTIYGYICENESLHHRLKLYLEANKLHLGISDINFLEMQDARHLRDRWTQLLCSVPVVFLKPARTIITSEIENHLRGTVVDPIAEYPSEIQNECKHANGAESFSIWNTVRQLRTEMIQLKDPYVEYMKKESVNVNAIFNGKVTLNDAPRLAFTNALLGYLQNYNPEYMQVVHKLMRKGQDFPYEAIQAIPSLWALSMSITYRNYIGKQNVDRNDMGDLLQVPCINHVRIAYVENQLHDELNQLKHTSTALPNTEIRKRTHLVQALDELG